jgi:hypothetical protein
MSLEPMGCSRIQNDLLGVSSRDTKSWWLHSIYGGVGSTEAEGIDADTLGTVFGPSNGFDWHLELIKRN